MVRFCHVARSYREREVLVDVHFTVPAGELALVTGPAASGKTTLIRLLLGLDVPRRGWITVDGLVLGGSPPAALAAHRRRCAVIPQGCLLIPAMSALDNVALALEVQGKARGEARRVGAETLERVGLGHLAPRPASALSAGERRWVAIARALARSDAPLLIADEPGTLLASEEVALIGALLEAESARGKTVIVTSRESRLAGVATARVVTLRGGRAFEPATGERAVARRVS